MVGNYVFLLFSSFCFDEHADKSLSEEKYIYGMYV